MRGVVAAFEVRGDVAAQPVLELLVRGVAYAVQRMVEGREVEAVRRIGHGGGHEGLEFGAQGFDGGVLLLEVGPGDGGAPGVGGEQAVVVGEAEFLVDEGPHVAAEVVSVGAGEEFVDLGGAEEAGQRRPFAGPVVADLGVVGDAAPRTDVQDRLASRGDVRVPLVPPAAPLRQEHHQVDEGQAEAADEDVLAGRERGQVTVRGEVGRQVDESVLACVRAQLPLFLVEFGVEVALGEDDGVGEEGAGTPVEPHLLAALAGAADAQGAARMVPDGDPRRERGNGPLVHPAQIGT